MRKLLAANFARLRKDGTFWTGIVLMFAGGIFLTVMAYFDMKSSGYEYKLEERTFLYAVYSGIVSSVFCSLFLGTEYSDGTIRNKLMVGHSRGNIYLANLIVCSVASILMCLIYFVSATAVGTVLLGFFVADIRIVLGFVLCSLAMTAAYAGIYTLVAMLNQNKAIAAVICVLGSFILLFVGIYVNQRLEEPKTYPVYMYADETGEIRSEENEPNPTYLSGTKREVYEFLYDFLPSGQALQLTQMTAEHLWALALYDGILVVLTTGAGVLCFRRKDLK